MLFTRKLLIIVATIAIMAVTLTILEIPDQDHTEIPDKTHTDTAEETLKAAIEFENAGLPDKAIELLVPIAVDGDQRAQFLLGSVYISKKNESDYMRGYSWVARAAMQGEPGAFFFFGPPLSGSRS